MIYTEHTELEDGKFYYCLGSEVDYISTFTDLPNSDDYYSKFNYHDHWTSNSGFLEATDTCCYEDIDHMQHYLLPDVKSAEDVELYVKSHPELAL